MQQMFPQGQPPKKSFMEQAGWQLIIIAASLLAGITGTIIVGIWQGTTHIIDFNQLVLIFTGIMLNIAIFSVWHGIRTGRKYQEQYNKNLADMKSDVQTFKNDYRKVVDGLIQEWNNWVTAFNLRNAQEQMTRSSEINKKCMETIADAENRIRTDIKNTETILTSTVKSYESAVDLYREQLIQTVKRMDALEEKLKNDPPPDSEV